MTPPAGRPGKRKDAAPPTGPTPAHASGARVAIYDTTLRDGCQAEDVNLSVHDKVRAVGYLDDLGVRYIEGGWPSSNPRETEFFERVRDLELKHAQITAFGSTHRASNAVEDDVNVAGLLASGVDVITIFGKSWNFHVTSALNIPLERNLELIRDTVRYLKAHRSRVFYDAEHFFDGYKADPEYAIATIQAAQEGGADCLVLCDTNGGSMPWEVRDIMQAVRPRVTAPLGIHCHNDSEVAVANSLTAIQCGATQVQGTINGFGERCGNANLISVIANLELKMGIPVLPPGGLGLLKETSGGLYELANLTHNKHMPYVGESAFAHKGGIHVSAVEKNAATYEHVAPETVGNHRRVLISDYSGRSNILYKAKEFGIDLSDQSALSADILAQLKDLEASGFQFEGAEASFELLIRKAMGTHRRFFELAGFRVIAGRRGNHDPSVSEAIVKVRVGGQERHEVSEGDGPVNALDLALRKALAGFYPQIAEFRLLDYKVRVLTGSHGTASRVRVLVESGDAHGTWGTVGVSSNIIEASYQALVDAIEFRLMRGEEPEPHE
ncbi:MAG: citramalate synthase [Nitrospirota bacterium]|nr:citramalate synthase [Nitrospirota bacterium]